MSQAITRHAYDTAEAACLSLAVEILCDYHANDEESIKWATTYLEGAVPELVAHLNCGQLDIDKQLAEAIRASDAHLHSIGLLSELVRLLTSQPSRCLCDACVSNMIVKAQGQANAIDGLTESETATMQHITALTMKMITEAHKQ